MHLAIFLTTMMSNNTEFPADCTWNGKHSFNWLWTWHF